MIGIYTRFYVLPDILSLFHPTQWHWIGYLCYRKCPSLLPFCLRFSPSTNPTALSSFKSLIWYLFSSCCREVYICQMPSYREQVKTVFSKNAVIFISLNSSLYVNYQVLMTFYCFWHEGYKEKKFDSTSDSAYSRDIY